MSLLKRFFSKSGEVAPYEMFSFTHMVMLSLCILALFFMLNKTRGASQKQVKRIVKGSAYILWALEFLKIIFNLFSGNADEPNTYIPLYFCSITLYAAVLSGWAKGYTAKRIGDVFLVVGGIIGGAVYIFMPTTTAGVYPAFHFITIQSYILHTVMIFLGELYIVTDYIKLRLKDIIYYASTVSVISLIAWVFNYFFDSNLMFVSKDFPGTLVGVLYDLTGRFFPLAITFIQAVPPFYLIYGIIKLYKRGREKEIRIES